jgi:hypothetical protein
MRGDALAEDCRPPDARSTSGVSDEATAQSLARRLRLEAATASPQISCSLASLIVRSVHEAMGTAGAIKALWSASQEVVIEMIATEGRAAVLTDGNRVAV